MCNMKGVVFLLFVQCAVIFSQTVRRATLLEHRAYVIEVIEKMVNYIEDYQWCNLKIADFTQDVDFEFYGRSFPGRISYKNGFVVSIQHADIRQDSVQQSWTWRSATRTGQVDVKGLLRLHDVVFGFDVEAELDGILHRYTSTFTHRLLNFQFSILKDMTTQNITVTVTGTQPPSTNRIQYVPSDDYSDLIGAVFEPATTSSSVQAWASDIFTPITRNIVMNEVDFPEVCYNC